jgi:hypothetical protein
MFVDVGSAVGREQRSTGLHKMHHASFAVGHGQIGLAVVVYDNSRLNLQSSMTNK